MGKVILRNPRYIGYDCLGAAENMAIDESMLSMSERTGDSAVRFYSFTKPTIILSSSDHPGNIKMENLNGTDVSRRKTGGKPIYLDDGVLAYSITGRVEGHKEDWLHTQEKIHAELGRIVADAISDVTGSDGVSLGKSYSIRVDGRPIAGNGQRINASGAFLYHGVIAIGRWDAERIGNLLRLVPEDRKELMELPSIQGMSQYGIESLDHYKILVARAILKRIGLQMSVSEDVRNDIISGARSFIKEYSNPEFIFDKSDGLKLSSRFCLLWEG